MAESSIGFQSSLRCDAQTTNNSVRQSSQSSRKITVSPSYSSPSTTGNGVPLRTCDWTRSVVDELGLRCVCKQPSDIVTEHMSAALTYLLPHEINDLDKLTDILGNLNNLDDESLCEVDFKSLKYFPPHEAELRKEVKFKEIDISTYSIFLKRFGLGLWYALKESQPVISEAKYQYLYEQFLQMFGVLVMAQPVVNTESTKIFRKKVSSRADIVCLSQKDDVRCSLAVSEVKKECCSEDIDVGPTAPKLRRTDNTSEDLPVVKENTSLPDGLPAQHVEQLLTYLPKSVCKEALLGMTMDKTSVTFTRLFVKEDTMTKIRTSSRDSFRLKEEERPILYYSKPYNYLLKKDRKEIVKALLTLTILEHRRVKKT